MINITLPDDTQTDLKGFISRHLLYNATASYDKPCGADPVLHRALTQMHLHYAFEYVHHNVTTEQLKSITVSSGMPLPYLLFAYADELKGRYQSLYGKQALRILNANSLAQPVISTLSYICGCIIDIDSNVSVTTRSLPRNKSLYLISTIEQTDYLEASYLFHGFQYNRSDDLSLLHDPIVNALWHIGDYLKTHDPISLINAVTQLSEHPCIHDLNSSVAQDIGKALSNPRMMVHIPIQYHPLVEVSKYFKSPIGDGWIEYLKMMTPIFNGASASRISLIQNVFFNSRYPTLDCDYEQIAMSSTLATQFEQAPYTFLSEDVEHQYFPTTKKSLRKFIFNQDVKYHECA